MVRPPPPSPNSDFCDTPVTGCHAIGCRAEPLFQTVHHQDTVSPDMSLHVGRETVTRVAVTSKTLVASGNIGGGDWHRSGGPQERRAKGFGLVPEKKLYRHLSTPYPVQPCR